MKPGDLVQCKPYPSSPIEQDDLFKFNEEHSLMCRGEFRYNLSDLAFILKEKEFRDFNGEWIMWLNVMFPTGIGWLPASYMEPV